MEKYNHFDYKKNTFESFPMKRYHKNLNMKYPFSNLMELIQKPELTNEVLKPFYSKFRERYRKSLYDVFNSV